MTLSLATRIENTNQLLRMVKAIPPHRFVSRLSNWQKFPTFWQHLLSGFSNKPVACVGGHVALDDYFRGLGVRSGGGGEPYISRVITSDYMNGSREIKDSKFVRKSGFELATFLFGSRRLFEPIPAVDSKWFSTTKAEVIKRIEDHLRFLNETQMKASLMIARFERLAQMEMIQDRIVELEAEVIS